MPLIPRSIFALAAALLVGSASVQAAPGGFNPRGRTSATKRSVKPRTAAKPTKASQAELIDRYTNIVRQQPGAPFPLQRLVQLVRERDGHLRHLIERVRAQVRKSGKMAKLQAQLTLAGLLVHSEQWQEAHSVYAAVVSATPDNVAARSQWAQLFARQGNLARAISTLKPVVDLRLSKIQRDESLQQLIRWALDTGTLTAAQEFHRKRVAQAGNSIYVQAQFGRQLMDRRMFSAAESEYRKILRTARTDPRTLAPAVRDLGQALLAQNKYEEAIEILGLAKSPGRTASGVLQEIDGLTATAFRALNRMPELIERVKTSTRKDPDHWIQLAELYREIGQLSDSVAAFTQALRARPRAVDARLALIELLQLQGNLKRVLDHRQTLVRQVPGNPTYALQLAEAHLQSGRRDKALSVLRHLERTSRHKEDTQLALVRAYEKLQEPQRALTLLKSLAQSGQPQHLVQLGEHYFSNGKTDKAIATWKKLLRSGDAAGAALDRLGEVYLDHDLSELAVTALNKAHLLAPDNRDYARHLALSLEKAILNLSKPKLRNARKQQALQLWQSLQRQAQLTSQSYRAREARQHIIGLWSQSKTLEQHTKTLRSKLHGSPPDLQAGRLLVEALMRQRQYEEAQSSLEFLLSKAPGDTSSRRALEMALARQSRWEQAIEVLQHLAQSDPSRAREYFEKIARHAEKLYQDDRALQFSIRAVQLAPEDAQGHLRLGDRYRERQQLQQAAQEYRLSLRHDPRLFSAHFQLAQLLMQREKWSEADQHLRQIVRESTDDQQVARAARTCMQLHWGQGSLSKLETDLLPLALSHPQRPVFRRLLVEIYDELTRPLLARTRGVNPRSRSAAREQLAKIGTRAVKPLLDTLSDSEVGQQQVALLLLSVLKNRDAGPALLQFAAGSAATHLRLKAMSAVAVLRDATLLPRLEDFLWNAAASDGENDPVQLMAAWAVANIASVDARPLLMRLLEEPSPTFQTLAILGLDSVYRKSDGRSLAAIVESSAHSPLPRAAAAWVLSSHGDARALVGTTGLSQLSEPLVAGAALSALATLHSPQARSRIADALLDGQSRLSPFAARAACYQVSRPKRPPPEVPPSGRISAATLLLAALPGECSAAAAAQALEQLREPLVRASFRVVLPQDEQLQSFVTMLRDPRGLPSLAPLSNRLDTLPAAAQQAARETLTQLSEAFLQPFLSIASNARGKTRRLALEWLAPHHHEAARRALVAALKDDDPSVQTSALFLLEKYPSALATPALASLLTLSPSWSIRRLAAQTLRSSATRVAPSVELARALTQSALTDSYALVRNEAARTLQALSPQTAHSVLETLAQSDAEPEVRETAHQLLDPNREY